MKNEIRSINLGPGAYSHTILNARGDQDLGSVSKYRKGGDWEVKLAGTNIGFYKGTKTEALAVLGRLIEYGPSLCESMAECHRDGEGASTIGFSHGVPTARVMRCVEGGHLYINLRKRR